MLLTDYFRPEPDATWDRCQDMRLRMKYVDIPSVLEADVEKAIRDRVEDGTGNLYVLVNYTALFSTRNILKKLEGEHK